MSRKRYRYIGKEKDDETQLHYHSARYYAGWVGRWISSDPAGLVDGVGRYAYCRGDPVGRRDGSGLEGPTADDSASPSVLGEVTGAVGDSIARGLSHPDQLPVIRNGIIGWGGTFVRGAYNGGLGAVWEEKVKPLTTYGVAVAAVEDPAEFALQQSPATNIVVGTNQIATGDATAGTHRVLGAVGTVVEVGVTVGVVAGAGSMSRPASPPAKTARPAPAAPRTNPTPSRAPTSPGSVSASVEEVAS